MYPATWLLKKLFIYIYIFSHMIFFNKLNDLFILLFKDFFLFGNDILLGPKYLYTLG